MGGLDRFEFRKLMKRQIIRSSKSQKLKNFLEIVKIEKSVVIKCVDERGQGRDII